MCPTKQYKGSLGYYQFILEKNANYRTRTDENAARASDLSVHFDGLLRSTKASLIKYSS